METQALEFYLIFRFFISFIRYVLIRAVWLQLDSKTLFWHRVTVIGNRPPAFRKPVFFMSKLKSERGKE